MIDRAKLQHILEYAKQQRHIGLHCKVPPEDMVEIVEMAMLQGAEAVMTANKLPDDFDFDRFNDVTWLECIASNPHMHSLTTSTIAMVALELNRKLADGNVPVSPDGWVACSERLPENKPGSYEYLVFEELNNGVHHDYWNVPDAGDDCQFTPFWNHYERYVTHWQPLPSPPAK